jgi:phosphoribosylformimino-5-aminoimidazole carboxamide ribotide isomerase
MAEGFTIFPAIDLRHGRVVRLAQGDPERQTTYNDDPVCWAERWKEAGTDWLHVINLDGAFGEDTHPNLKVLESLLKLGLNVEFGGGIRDQVTIKTCLDLGVNRVFLGTAAVQEPALLDWAIRNYGPTRIAVDIGSRNGKVTIRGWQDITSLTVLELGERFHAQGIRWCVLTDVLHDGVSTGINIISAVELQKATAIQVIASGGVNSIADVQSARKSGLAGIIIGRALYDEKVSLRAALAAASD